MFVCHTCDNRRCTNPDHLFLASCKGNNHDMMEKGRSPILGKNGQENPMSKLTEEQVKEIRGELDQRKGISKSSVMRYGLSQKKLAEKFGVSQATISMINTNNVHQHAVGG